MRLPMRIFFTLCTLCVLLLFLGMINKTFSATTKPNKQAQMLHEEAYEVTGPKTVQVLLERTYLDGEKSVETVEETIWAMEDFWAQYEGWELVEQSDAVIKFHKDIHDISPLLKTNGYFGLSDEGILTIFEGKPPEEKAIQSFYQINVEKLESKVIDQLKEGIPVKSKQDYLALLKKLKRYEK